MKRSLKNVLSFLGLIGLLVSCHVEKRHYRSGYHVTWHHSLKGTSGVENNKIGEINTPTETDLPSRQITTRCSGDGLSANASSDKSADLELVIKKPVFNPTDSCGDVLLLKNGEEQKVKIFEVSDRIIKYKRCNNLGGPLYTINKAQLFMIKYANGTKELVKEEVRTINGVPVDDRPVVKKNNGWAIASFVCACLFFLIVPWILAPIFGCIGAYQIDNDRKKYKGRWMAIVGIVVGLLGVLIILGSL